MSPRGGGGGLWGYAATAAPRLQRTRCCAVTVPEEPAPSRGKSCASHGLGRAHTESKPLQNCSQGLQICNLREKNTDLFYKAKV